MGFPTPFFCRPITCCRPLVVSFCHAAVAGNVTKPMALADGKTASGRQQGFARQKRRSSVGHSTTTTSNYNSRRIEQSNISPKMNSRNPARKLFSGVWAAFLWYNMHQGKVSCEFAGPRQPSDQSGGISGFLSEMLGGGAMVTVSQRTLDNPTGTAVETQVGRNCYITATMSTGTDPFMAPGVNVADRCG